jgi:hypothetical protein
MEEYLIADAHEPGHFGSNPLVQFSVLLKQVLPPVPEIYSPKYSNSKKQKCSEYCYI